MHGATPPPGPHNTHRSCRKEATPSLPYPLNLGDWASQTIVLWPCFTLFDAIQRALDGAPSEVWHFCGPNADLQQKALILVAFKPSPVESGAAFCVTVMSVPWLPALKAKGTRGAEAPARVPGFTDGSPDWEGPVGLWQLLDSLPIEWMAQRKQPIVCPLK